MSETKRNLPASIHRRLLNKAHETGQAFNELLQYYAIERLLYRLSISEHADKFVLKGALMFNAWGLTNFRPTRDIDLLGYTQNGIEHVVSIFQDVCKLNTEPDGLEFDAKHVQGERIKEEAEYEGIRIDITARLGKSWLPIQIDIGFADVVTPAPASLEYPTILNLAAPRLYGYPPETILAEKFQAMTVLGMANSRMKDFYDIWMLITKFEFSGTIVQRALQRTFENRSTELPSAAHVIFSDEFVETKRGQWRAFLGKIGEKETTELEQVLVAIHDFFLPIVRASQQGKSFKKRWKKKWK
jgi:predicted nucleotidyltransferase component of viral defense system